MIDNVCAETPYSLITHYFMIQDKQYHVVHLHYLALDVSLQASFLTSIVTVGPRSQNVRILQPAS